MKFSDGYSHTHRYVILRKKNPHNNADNQPWPEEYANGPKPRKFGIFFMLQIKTHVKHVYSLYMDVL